MQYAYECTDIIHRLRLKLRPDAYQVSITEASKRRFSLQCAQQCCLGRALVGFRTHPQKDTGNVWRICDVDHEEEERRASASAPDFISLYVFIWRFMLHSRLSSLSFQPMFARHFTGKWTYRRMHASHINQSFGVSCNLSVLHIWSAQNRKT